MNILLLTQQMAAYRSGVGTYARNLLEGLVELGQRVSVVLPEDQSQPFHGAGLIEVKPARWDPTPGRWFSLGVEFAKVLKRLQRGFDVVHFTDAREAWCIGKLERPLTGMVNDAYALEWFESAYPRRLYSDRLLRSLYYRWLRRMERPVYAKLDAVIANSRHVGDRISAGYGLPQDRIKVVYYGLSSPPLEEGLKLPGAPALVFIGGNFLRKGLPHLIEATAALSSRFPETILHVIGKDSNQPTLARLAESRGISGRVTFHGWQPNKTVRRMLAGADILVLPSLTEGFGLVYLEAMQVGTPVVATCVGGAKEVFRNHQEAVFVDPERVGETVRAVERIVTDEAFKQRLRENGRRAAAQFSPRRMAEQTLAVWSSLR